MRFSKLLFLTSSLLLISCGAAAHDEGFKTGPVFEQYGKSAQVQSDLTTPLDMKYKVSFDVAEAARPGEINRKFDSLARFINMHVKAGVPLENIELALVVHGGASKELVNSDVYEGANSGKKHANESLLKALMESGVKVYLCGQSAVYHGVSKSDLIPGVEMALSAMTVHAILQQGGYSINPF